MPKIQLRLTNLHVDVENQEILRGVSLKINPGEIHAVMGPNGSGKSTLAHSLAGHPSYTVTKGKISLGGAELLEKSPDERSKLGLFLAFQYPVEIPGLTVQQFLRAVHEEHHGPLDSVLTFFQELEKLCEQLSIPTTLLKRGLNDGFSGGEKKRVELLQMAVIQPKFAMMDETDSGLDIDAIRKVAKAIRWIVDQQNTGLIVITHYQRILKYLSPDFVHVLVKGKVVESGGPELAKKLEKQGYAPYVQIRTD